MGMYDQCSISLDGVHLCHNISWCTHVTTVIIQFVKMACIHMATFILIGSEFAVMILNVCHESFAVSNTPMANYIFHCPVGPHAFIVYEKQE